MQGELDAIRSWLKGTTEAYDDWDWDGSELVLFEDDEPIERYSKEDLEEEGVFDGSWDE